MDSRSDKTAWQREAGMAREQALPDFPGFSEQDLCTSVPARFEKIVRRYPEKLAVKSSRHAWSYDELNRGANRLAHAILDASGPDCAPVALLFEHDAPAIAAMIGVLKAGKFHVCLEPSFPLPRNEAILADLQAPLLLCDRANLPAALGLAKSCCRLLVYDAIGDAYSPENPGLSITAQMPLAVFYTSGSTGQPKGVQWNQDLFLHRILVDTEDSAISPQDCHALFTSLTFPGSTGDINLALLNGASLHLYDLRKFGTAYLAQWLRQEQISCLRMSTALFRHFLASLDEKDAFPSVRMIGLRDALFRKDIETARAHFPASCRIIYRYAITEAGLVTRLIIGTDTPLATPVVPVGYPTPGKQVLILDENRRELSANEIGEIAIRSSYLAAGYWRRPEQTRLRFIPDPADARSVVYLTGDLGRVRADGCLEFLGRRDFRVKIRGFQIEPAAVEAALCALDTVKDAAVMPQPDPNDETSLVAYIVPAVQPAPDAGALRRMLATELPEYMLPSAFVFLEALPLTRGGKVDRQALPRPGANHRQSTRQRQAPRNPTEVALAMIWSDVLKLDHIDVDDNFFELGGHSLLAARVIARVNEKFQVGLLLRSLYDAPTVAALAALIENGSRHGAADPSASRNEEPTLQEAIRLLGLT
jgi:amino acid adenylation domain-containing protein